MAWSPEREHTRADCKDDDVPFPVRGVPGGWRDWFDADDRAAANADRANQRQHRKCMLVARAVTGRGERGTPYT
jgi:hypothetical protein